MLELNAVTIRAGFIPTYFDLLLCTLWLWEISQYRVQSGLWLLHVVQFFFLFFFWNWSSLPLTSRRGHSRRTREFPEFAASSIDCFEPQSWFSNFAFTPARRMLPLELSWMSSILISIFLDSAWSHHVFPPLVLHRSYTDYIVQLFVHTNFVWVYRDFLFRAFFRPISRRFA